MAIASVSAVCGRISRLYGCPLPPACVAPSGAAPGSFASAAATAAAYAIANAIAAGRPNMATCPPVSNGPGRCGPIPTGVPRQKPTAP
jgi:hypothetical protein